MFAACQKALCHFHCTCLRLIALFRIYSFDYTNGISCWPFKLNGVLGTRGMRGNMVWMGLKEKLLDLTHTHTFQKAFK